MQGSDYLEDERLSDFVHCAKIFKQQTTKPKLKKLYFGMNYPVTGRLLRASICCDCLQKTCNNAHEVVILCQNSYNHGM